MSEKEFMMGEEEFEVRKGKGRIITLIIIVLVILILGGGGFYIYNKEKKRKEAERLFQEAMDLPEDERGEALLKLLDAPLYEAFKATVVEELGYLYYKPSLNKLISLLKGRDKVSWKASVSIAMILTHYDMEDSNIAKEVKDKIFELLKGADGIAKAYFSYALALLGDSRAVEPLLESMYDGFTKDIEGFTPRLVAKLLRPDQVVKLLDNPDPAVKVFAIQTAGEMKAKEAIPKLKELLEMKGNPVIVSASAEALAKIDPEGSGPSILKLIREEPELREKLIIALRDSVGAPGLKPIYDEADWSRKNEIVEHLRLPPLPGDHIRKIRGIGDPRVVDLCYDLYKNGPTERTKLHGLWCLEEFGDERAKQGLLSLANDDNPIDELSDEAIKSLGKLKFKGVRKLFIKMLKERRGRPATLLLALGRQKNPEDGAIIAPYANCKDPEASDCDETVALRALGMTGWNGALKLLIKKAKRGKNEVEAQDIASRDWTREGRLMSRRSAIIGLGFLGSPEAADFLISVIEDTKDDPEVRLLASESLAYCVNDKVISEIIKKIKDPRLDPIAKKYYINSLRVKPNKEAVDYLLELLKRDDTDDELIIPIGFALGEAGKDMVPTTTLLKILKEHRLSSNRVAAGLALLIGGHTSAMDDLVKVFEQSPSLHGIIRDNFERYPLYLTEEMFKSLRLFNRLDSAWRLREIDKVEYGWAWNHIMNRLIMGWDEKPNGLTSLEIRNLLLDYLRKGDEHIAKLSARALMGMGLRGYLLMVIAEGGKASEIARDVLDEF